MKRHGRENEKGPIYSQLNPASLMLATHTLVFSTMCSQPAPSCSQPCALNHVPCAVNPASRVLVLSLSLSCSLSPFSLSLSLSLVLSLFHTGADDARVGGREVADAPLVLRLPPLRRHLAQNRQLRARRDRDLIRLAPLVRPHRLRVLHLQLQKRSRAAKKKTQGKKRAERALSHGSKTCVRTRVNPVRFPAQSAREFRAFSRSFFVGAFNPGILSPTQRTRLCT